GHIGPHHHARPAARRRVIDGAMLADTLFANIAHIQRAEVFLPPLARKRCPQGAGNHCGKQRQDGGLPDHGWLSPSPAPSSSSSPASMLAGTATVRRPPLMSITGTGWRSNTR